MADSKDKEKDKSGDQEKEIFEFLDSLPEDEKNGAGSATDAAAAAETANQNGNKKGNKDTKSDADILNFLDELEDSSKKDKKNGVDDLVLVNESKDEDVVEGTGSEDKGETTKESVSVLEAGNESENAIDGAIEDPIKSITSWWNTSGSNAVSSLWGTAQSLSEHATKQAEEAIKKAKDIQIPTSIDEVNATKAIEELNLGINSSLNYVVDRIQKIKDDVNEKDEIIEVYLIHDMNIEKLDEIIKNKFENVMKYQVEGNIEIKILEKSINNKENNQEDFNLALFNGKGSDAEKLLLANIENEIKNIGKNDSNSDVNGDGDGDGDGEGDNNKEVNITRIFIGLISWSSSKDLSNEEVYLKNSNEILIDSHSSTSFTFLTILKDLKNNIQITNNSQPIPLKWMKWIEGDFKEGERDDDIDPSDWVVGWFYNTIGNLMGITLQSYIIKRMGY